MSKLKSIFLVFLGVILISGLLLAQENTGKVVGTVTDNEGLAIPGVSVEATSPAMVGTATAVTDANGTYRLLALPVGTYTIEYSLTGFKTVVRKGIQVRVEQTITVDIAIEPGAIEEEVTVIGQSPLVDVKSTTKGMTQTKEMFEKLPRGRNFDTLVTTIPGVNQESWLSGVSVDGASGAENMYYVDGMDITALYGGTADQSAAYEFVEEVQIKASGYQAEYGGAMGGVVNVITRSGGNEFHGEVIGYYSGSSLTTKERDTLRINPMDTTEAEYVNYQDLYGKDKINRYEIGFNLGGYIVKDAVWFYGTFLPVFRDRTRHVEWLTGDPATDHTMNQTWWNGQFKMTAQPLKGLRLAASFLGDFYKWRGDLPARSGTGNPDKEWGDYGFDFPSYSASFNADYTVGNNFLISARAGYFRENTTNQQVVAETGRYAFYEEITYSPTTNAWIPGIPDDLVRGAFYTNYGYGDGFETKKDIQSRMKANLDATFYMDLAGEHSWKAGIQGVRIDQDIDDSYKYDYILFGWGKTLHWPDGTDYSGEYGYYGVRGAFEDENHPKRAFGTFANPHSYRWAIYLQDTWTPDFLNDRFTLNFGVRAEKEDIPSFSDLPEYQDPPITFGFGDKIAPRIGFIYDLFGDAKTKIFGSYGIYYDVMKLDMAVGSYGGFKWITEYYTLDTYQWQDIGQGNYPGEYIGYQNWRLPSFDTTDPDLKPMAQMELSFGLEQEIMENLSGSVRFVYKHLIRAIEDVGVQTPTGEQYYTANPGFGWTRPVSEGGKFSDDYLPCPEAKREYYAVNINIDKRFSNNWLGGFSYTWSYLWGNYAGLASSDERGRNSPNVERYFDLWFMNYDQNGEEVLGKLATDRPHQFKVYGSYVFPFGLTLGVVANGMSGLPVTKEFQTGHIQGYYPEGRFTDGRSPFLFFVNGYAEYNLDISEKFTVQLNLNVDNLFDTKTARSVYQLLNQDDIYVSDADRIAGWNWKETDYEPDPQFGKEYRFYPPLSARIGVKLIF
ncbi:MAG: TonB-dependent receptor [Candidatus Aminicenantaceae bacterium]